MRLFVFGLGYVGEAFANALRARGWEIAATARTPQQAQALQAKGVSVVDPGDRDAMARVLTGVNAILVTAPPGPDGCPALESIVPALAQAQAFPDWIGYLSTTGVYGDFDGRWVFETSPLKAQSVEGARRVGAERDWQEVGRGMGLTVTVFRLPGIYGPGRSALDRLRAGEGRRIVKPGQVFSRIHVDDIVSGLLASLDKPRAGGVYNLVDDEPAPPQDVMEQAARLLGAPVPPDLPFNELGLSPATRRFYAENKRVSNARVKAELGWRPAYPTYREGLQAILNAGG
ncbi:SDR family NAD(P)-dependent oxidoreductase [Caulobacter segnis]|uniref:NAD-dependent epimerase/dehydratase n=2 Tax=Caulobacter segnis TaxID=88688 RepID=D5VMD6_CAUST|nr:SDR family oxidoreductase [Caulobacter segnis]ADG11659.1 NAD-dependent epimerase/dehydratase [Caulobacter segnis ATCC 21756]AVQ03305.1 SDR family NAD(P)-dependent oxidoreductase [Caulobacter segnis]